MDGTATLEIPAPQRRKASWCDECGYSLRGLPAGRACPECGRVPSGADDHVGPHLAWARSVSVGLIVLLGLTFYAVSSVLIQPFTNDVAGSMTALNMPGPKLWAVPLLQRPLGYSPETPGVVGTRTALLAALAVWLVTAPCGAIALQRDQALRLATRWGCMITFGIAFGVLMGTQGLSKYDDYRFYRLLVIGGVELPGTTLLYLYLRRLSDHVAGRERRATFDRLVWLVPLTILIAAVVLTMGWWRYGNWRGEREGAWAIAIGAGYGTIALICGVMASSAVAGLAGAYVQLAFPRAGKWVTGARHLWRGATRALADLPSERARRLGVAAGALVIVFMMVIGNDVVLWMTSRQGLGANLPFLNFAGPKVWAAAALSGSGQRFYWDSMVTRTSFLFFHLVGLWLITIPLRPTSEPRAMRQLRCWVRWLPIVCLGAALALIGSFFELFPVGSTPGGGDQQLLERYRSELFALCTLILEVPPTLLLYTYLSRVAGEVGRAKLAREFRVLRVAIVALVGGSFSAFVLSRWLRPLSTTPVVLAACAVYGAGALSVAAWATGAVLRLGAGVVVTGSELGVKENRLASEAANLDSSMFAV